MKEWKKTSKKILSLVLVMCMIIGLVPMNSLAAPKHKVEKPVSAVAESEADVLATAMAEAKTYIDALTINNSKNDPGTVVSNYGTHFTWDNEKRESGKSYLYDWSYYNGVVFEGLEYVYEETKDEVYGDYVEEYMSSLIASNGTWAKCKNNSSKECAGYNSTHGADCYKTASLLLDLYERTNDSRYLTMAATLYSDLDSAANKYSLSNAGKNYRHTWASDSNPDLWLDGLYMILPFRAEYAKHINDTEELDLIVDRMQWVSDNMYDANRGLFYHAADNASSNSGTFWLRSMGWYVAAIVDIMDSMEGENLEAMKKQLVKFVDGMKAVQNTSNGMWLNNMKDKQSNSNPYETSGTALVCYAVMKAVNEGWLDASYADMAILAFEGICNEKLNGTTLKDICFKGAPGSSNSTFYDNEGKGVGPFIMFYAEIMEYVNKQAEEKPEEPETPEEPVEPEIPTGTVVVGGKEVTVAVENVADMTVSEAAAEDLALVEEKAYSDYIFFDVEATMTGDSAVVSVPVPEEWNITSADQLVGLSAENGELKEIAGTLENGVFSFEVDHFSGKGIARATGNLSAGKNYQLDTNGVETDGKYIIVAEYSGKFYALSVGDKNNNDVKVIAREITTDGNTFSVEDDSKLAMTLSGASGQIKISPVFEEFSKGTLEVGGDAKFKLNETKNVFLSNKGNGQYTIEKVNKNGNPEGKYLTFGLKNNILTWTEAGETSVYLFKYVGDGTAEEVEFTINPTSVTMMPETTTTLTGTVTVAGNEVDLSNCTITWASGDGRVATVQNGTITSVGIGTTNITATLSEVNGVSLKKAITVSIPVTVQYKEIASWTLTGNTPVTTKQNVEPDFSNIELDVIYADGEKATITVGTGLRIEGYDISEIGYTYADIIYAGVDYGDVRVTVEGNPYAGLEDATVYPEYPADGAVRIDKTATHSAETFKNTGVTHIELDVAGISVLEGTDVVLTVDVSNSMCWETGSGEKEYVDYNKLDEVMEAIKRFAAIFLADNEDGTPTKNTVTIVTFAGWDKENGNNNSITSIDSVRTLVSATRSIDVVNAVANNTMFTEADTIQFGYIPEGNDANVVDNVVVTESTGNRGDTNYDYGFWQTEQAIISANLGANNRKVNVLFMTDGCASNFNNDYYRSSNVGVYFQPGTKNTYNAPKNAYDNGTAWVNAILDSIATNGGNIYAKRVYDLVDGIYAIGFDMAHGSFSGISTWDAKKDWEEAFNDIVSKVVIDENGNGLIPVTAASDSATLNVFYESLAAELLLAAGTSAQVTDIIDSDFTLQMANYSGSGDKTAPLNDNLPSIAVTAYDLYTKEDNATDEEGNDLTGFRKGTKTVMEYVRFNDDGTEAYSDQKGEVNIMSTGLDGTVTIEGFYFTYTKTPEGVESFKWTIGDITEQEIVLAFDVYLKGALEGEAEKGTYYTNEEAILEYIDINGKYATQIFDVPHVNWGGASTTIRFYLVNEMGEPVNHAGDVIPWANRIYVGEPVNVNLNLNADLTVQAQTIEAAAYVPGEYFLYDNNAKYTVATASGEIVTGGITISEPSEDAFKTTYDDNGNPVTQNGAQTTRVIDAEGTYYTWSVVGFGVRYDLTKEKVTPLNPDTIVMDYGKNIQVDVLANDTEVIPEGWTAELVGFAKYNTNTDVEYIQANPGSETYTGENKYGAFSIVEDVVNYKPEKMLSTVQKVFCVIKFAETEENYHYRYNVLNIVPATSVYYETDFADNVFKIVSDGSEWDTAKVTDNDLTSADNLQDDGTIGQNPAQTYGYDSSYENDAYLSNRTSYYVEGQGYDSNKAPKTYTTFSFRGTGFEIISRTGEYQGLIKVEVTNTKGENEKTISVLNKSESKLELYQIPVVSINDLGYGTHHVKISVDAEYETNIPALASLNRGNQFFFDAIRVFDPAYGNQEAEAAYVMDGEANRQLSEVRSLLLTQDAFNALDSTAEGMIFLDRTEDDELGVEDNNTLNVATYAAIGPNNETYLANGQAVAFKINANSIPASVDIGAKSITGAAAELKATITNNNGTSMTTTKSIASSTAQNINLLANAEKTNTIFSGDNVYVVITNTGDGVLSITDIKVAFGDNAAAADNEIEVASYGLRTVFAAEEEEYDPYAVSYSVDAATFMLARTILMGTDDEIEELPDTNEPEEEKPEIDEPEVVPNYDIFNASATTVGEKKDEKTVITVETTQDVTKLTIVKENKVVDTSSVVYEDQEDGTRIWTVTVAKAGPGDKAYTVTGCGEDGTTGNSVSVTPPKKAPEDHKKK